MTAYLVDNEVRIVDSDGDEALINSGSLQVIVVEPSLSEVGLFAENITGSCYVMAIDLSNVSGSYHHDETNLSAIRISSIQGSIEKTKAQDYWKVQLGVCLETSLTGSRISWLSPGAQSLKDTIRFHNDIGFSQKNIIDLTVQSGSLTKLANNYNESLNDLTSQTILNDVLGRAVNVEQGDLVVRVKRLSNHGGSLSFHYHLWYRARD